MKEIQFVNNGFTIEAADGSGAKTISGIAVPYGVVATERHGRTFVMEAGALPTDGKKPKLLVEHDPQKPIGTIVSRVEAADGSGMLFTAKVAGTNLGNETMLLASEGVYDSVSIGITPTKWKMVDGVMHVQAARWNEVSIVNTPAFDGATITDVQASAEPEETQEEETPETQETEVAETPTPEAVVEASAPAIIPTPLFAQPVKAVRLPSAAEFMAAQFIGGDVAAAVNNQIIDFKKQSESTFEAAAGDETTSNLSGLLSTVVLGPVFSALAYISPIGNALGRRAMPNPGGSSFIRPILSTHTSVAAQSSELTAVSTTSGVVTPLSVSKQTLGGSFDISYQAMDFSSPDAYTSLINDLAGEYLLAEEGLFASAVFAAATSSGVWDLSATDFMTSIYDAAVDISSTTNRMPTHLLVSPDVWKQISLLADTTNRPLFAYTGGTGLAGYNALGNQNAGTWTGVNPMGLELVVSTKLAAKSMVILNKDAMELYSQPRGLLSVEQPSTLSRLVSIFGYAATANTSSQMVRKITQA